jgi:uncharacterized protein
MAAAVRGHTSKIESLIAQGTDVNEQSAERGCTALMWSITFGREDIFTRLLEAGANAELADSTGTTPLMIAANAGRFSMVEALFAAGADSNHKSNDGRTAFQNAKIMDRKDVIELLRGQI